MMDPAVMMGHDGSCVAHSSSRRLGAVNGGAPGSRYGARAVSMAPVLSHVTLVDVQRASPCACLHLPQRTGLVVHISAHAAACPPLCPRRRGCARRQVAV